MSNPAENKPLRVTRLDTQHSAEKVLSELKAAVGRRDWKLALFRVETLRFGHGWKYARFAAEFGAAEWESHAQELDAAGSGAEDEESDE